MRIVLLALTMVLVLGSNAFAQSYGSYYPQEFLWGLSWNLGLPTSNTKDYTDDFSLRGIGLEGRKFINPSMTVGLSFGWNVFWEKSFETEPTENLTVSGTQYRYLNFFPLMANVHKYWGYYGEFRPYLGLNAGTYIIENRLELGLFALQETNWHFGFAPEVGFQMPAGRFLGFVNVRYNYALKAGSTPEQAYWGFNVGVGLQ